MDQLGEYHDPDYPEAPVCVKEEPPSPSEEEKVEKIKSIIRREFSNELEARENEVRLIDQRMSSSRRLLHRLRYSLVNRYYSDQKLHLNSAQIQDEIAAQRDPRAKSEISSTLRDGQRHIHPSLRKLLGKQTVDISEIFRTRGPRNKTRKDYQAMLQKRNYTISADATKSLRPDTDEPCTSQNQISSQNQVSGQNQDTIQNQDSSQNQGSGQNQGSSQNQGNGQNQSTSQPRKVPRHLDPKPTNVLTLDEATRNQMKHRYRFIIGNTSKYVPAASRLDRSTHKWLLYIRGAPRAPDPSPLLAGAEVTLHHSYAPHHRVHLDKHPFHISRRGWGEFPAKIELHFTMPERNRPATVEHNIKLDRNYTGMQTLGSETIVDIWLYSTPDMLKYEYIEDDHTLTDIQTSIPPEKQSNRQEEPKIKEENEEWMEFFKTPTELDVDEMFVKPLKQDIKEEVKDEDFEEKIDTEIKENIQNILQLPTEILNQPSSVKKRIVKYIDPTTGKIYYLEMDRELDLTKVQEIIINNTSTKISPIKSNGLKSVRKRKGMSLLKPEVKNQLKENSIKVDRVKQDFPHLDNDHCYLFNPKRCQFDGEVNVKTEESLYESLVSNMRRFTDLRSAVNHLVKKIPLISGEARDQDFLAHFPFVVENSQRYWKLDYAKRRNIEWSRAKLINKLLSEHFPGPIWRTKQILLYIRLHGHYPVRNEAIIKTENDWSTWNDDTNIKETFPNATDINSLSVFKFDIDSLNSTIELSDDEEVDVTSEFVSVNVKKEVAQATGLQILPVDNDDDRLRFIYVERKCADIGIELRNEDVGNGYSYSAVHAVLLSAMRSFADELIRNSLAEKRRQESPRPVPSIWTGTPSSRTLVGLAHVWRGARRGRTRHLCAADTATTRENYCAL